jgi:hypothetical protein
MIRQRWTVELLQHGQEMDMLPYSSLSPSPQQRKSRIEISAQRKWRGKRRKRTWKTISFDVGSGEKLIKEEGEDACARPHSGKRHFVINEVNKDSKEGDYEDEGSTEEDINKESNKSEGENLECVRTGSCGFFVSSPNNNCKGGKDSMIGGGGPSILKHRVALAIMTATRTTCNMRHVLDVIAYSCFPTFARVLSIEQEKLRA